MSQPMGKIICKSHTKLTEAYNILNTLTTMQSQHLNRFTMMKKKMHSRYTSEETQEDKDKRVKFILKPQNDPSNSPVRAKIDNKYTQDPFLTYYQNNKKNGDVSFISKNISSVSRRPKTSITISRTDTADAKRLNCDLNST